MDKIANILNKNEQIEIDSTIINTIEKEFDRNETPEELNRILDLIKNNPNNDYLLCFDTETTGFSPTMDKLLEVSGVLYLNGKIIDSFKFLTNPFINPYDNSLPKLKPNWDYGFFKINQDVKPVVYNIHGINKNKLEKMNALHEDYYFDFIKEIFNDIQNITVMAHNLPFDRKFIKRILAKGDLDVEVKGIDTQTLLGDYQNDKINQSKHKRLMFNSIHKVYKVLMNEYQNENNLIILNIIKTINKINESMQKKCSINFSIKEIDFIHKIKKTEDKIINKMKFPKTLDCFYLFALGQLKDEKIIKINKIFDRNLHGGLIDSYMLGFVYQTYITKINIEASKIEEETIKEKELDNKLNDLKQKIINFSIIEKNIIDRYDFYAKLDNKLEPLNNKFFNILKKHKDQTNDKIIELLKENNILNIIDLKIETFLNSSSKIQKTKLINAEQINYYKNLKRFIYDYLIKDLSKEISKYLLSQTIESKKINFKPTITYTTDCSLGRGSLQIKTLPEDMDSFVLMDTNSINLGNAVRKFNKNNQYGAIIPISIKNKDEIFFFDLKVYVKNEEGMFNLYGSKNSILNYVNDDKIDIPRIDFNLLKDYNLKGLIFSTGAINGIIETLIKKNNKSLIKSFLIKLNEVFENFVIESYTNDLIYNNYLSILSNELNIPIIITNPLIKYDNDTHSILQYTLQQDEEYGSYNPFNIKYDLNNYNKNKEIIIKGISSNIIDLNNIMYKGLLPTEGNEPLLPNISDNADKDLIEKSHLFLKKYLDANPLLNKKIYKDRLDYELKIINDMGFPSYLLIVAEIIHKVKINNIPVGPGRGSAAGSLVTFVLNITSIDPLPHGLLFERFLNPERVSMPDIDIDFPLDMKIKINQVVPQDFSEYLENKYGFILKGKKKIKNNIILVKDFLYELMDKYYDFAYRISTKGTLAALSSIEAVCKALFEKDILVEHTKVSKEIKAVLPKELGFSLKKYLNDIFIDKKIDMLKLEALNPELYYLIKKSNLNLEDIMYKSMNLEGTIRTFGIHPAGVVVDPSKKGVMGNVYQKGNIKVITNDVSDEGGNNGFELVKFDLLSLRNLEFIQNCRNLIKERHLDETLNFSDLLDSKIYELIRTGHTVGMFQIESSGMQGLAKSLLPDNFEDITAMLALYRPGPMGSGMLDDFIKRKHGEEEIVFFKKEIYELIQNQNNDKTDKEINFLCEEEYLKIEKLLEPILKNTYGVIVYQEQVMAVVQAMGGYSLGEADIIRRAMGKKKVEVMEKHKIEFAERSEKKGINKEVASMVFGLIEKFAGYGFNKSHSAAYAMVTYQTAFLKTYYPLEFYTEVLNSKEKDQDNIGILYKDLKAYNKTLKTNKIIIKKANINTSKSSFTINNKNELEYGLISIKGVGVNYLKIDIARKNKKFKNFEDFIERVVNSGKKEQDINKTCFENLVLSGSLDCLDFKDTTNKNLLEKRKSFFKYYYEKINIKAAKIVHIEDKIDMAKKEIDKTGQYLSGNKIPLNIPEHLNALINNKNLNNKTNTLIGIFKKKPYIRKKPIKEINLNLYNYSTKIDFSKDDFLEIKKILILIKKSNKEKIIKLEKTAKDPKEIINKNFAIDNTLERLNIKDLNDNKEEIKILKLSLEEIYERNLMKDEGKNQLIVEVMLDDKDAILRIPSSCINDQIHKSVNLMFEKTTFYINGKFNENEYNGIFNIWVKSINFFEALKSEDLKDN